MLPYVKPFEAARAVYEKEGIHPEPRPMSAPVVPSKDVAQAAVEVFRESGTYMASVANLEPWNGKAQTGSFIDLGDGFVAQHAGRGVYRYMNVDEHLGGVQPPFGQTVFAEPDGAD